MRLKIELDIFSTFAELMFFVTRTVELGNTSNSFNYYEPVISLARVYVAVIHGRHPV